MRSVISRKRREELPLPNISWENFPRHIIRIIMSKRLCYWIYISGIRVQEVTVELEGEFDGEHAILV